MVKNLEGLNVPVVGNDHAPHHDAGGPELEVNRLVPYVSRLALEWLAERPEDRVHTVEGTLAFVDVSGFTALTERLAARGKAGAEEVRDSSVPLRRTAGHRLRVRGGDCSKWGGDAALLIFEEPDSAARAARATWLISRAMPRIGTCPTSVGRVRLGYLDRRATGAGSTFYLVGTAIGSW